MQELKQYDSDIFNAMKEELSDWQIGAGQYEPFFRKHFSKFTEGLEADKKQRLATEYFEYGAIQNLIEDDDITEIIINGPEDIFFEKKGRWVSHNDQFLSALSYHNFIQRICKEAGIVLSTKFPFACTKWKQFRVHFCLKEISGETCLSMRRHPNEHWDFRKLLDFEWCTDYQLELIQDILTDKENFLVVGATGTGKTSFLNACLDYLKTDERCLILEDSDELYTPNPLSLKMLTRSSTEGDLEKVSLQDLLKQALRMRPDRLILGEARGEEAKDLLMALSTGHSGSMASIHANSAHEAILRLEMMIQLGAPNWSLEAIRRLIFLSLKYIVVLEQSHTKRKLESIWKVVAIESFGVIIQKMR